MRTISKIVLLSAGVILSLTGCQKGNENDGNQASGKFVEFGAIAGAPGTRTEFSGVLTDGWERINWVEGDQLLIWSDNAVNRAGQSGKSAIYDLINIQPNGRESRAKIHRSGEDGLVFLDDENTPYQFWGIYPANAISAAPAAGELSYTIPATQTAGDMNNGVQLAYASIANQQHVDLHFKPAFTAFSFEVAAAVPMKINGFTMTSVERKNGANTFGPSVLSGSVAAKVEEGADAWTYTVPAAGEGNTSISTTFATPFDLAFENEGDTKTNEAKFVLFAVPADITSLTLLFDVTVDGKAETRKVSISYAKDGEGFAKGDPVSFAGRKKHNIKNLVLPASVNHDVVLDFQVMPWVDSEGTVTYGPDAIANAVALEYASGAQRMTGGSRRQNNWFANATDPIVAYFSVFAPEGGSWKIKVSGATDKLTVTASQLPLAGQTTAPTVSSATVDGVLELSGPIGSRVEFKVARANDATASDEIQLNFYAVLDGREISINSEVTRLNALTITGNVGQ